jgi:hypothetical protein
MRGERLMVRLAHVSDIGTIGKRKENRLLFWEKRKVPEASSRRVADLPPRLLVEFLSKE